MLKRLMALAILSGVVGGTVMAMSRPEPQPDAARVEAVIDARLHQLLVEMRLKRTF